MGESKIINIKTLVNKTGTFINEASVSGNEYDWDLKTIMIQQALMLIHQQIWLLKYWLMIPILNLTL